ncbi:MAG TPA: hypothetical protein P5026_05875 [Kiritimatiellia bacterium]|nr:hypothetical protein [Kiritimatiellia bacterium]
MLRGEQKGKNMSFAWVAALSVSMSLAGVPSYPTPIGCGDVIRLRQVTADTPAALLIHGGGWSGLDKKDVVGIANLLAEDLGFRDRRSGSGLSVASRHVPQASTLTRLWEPIRGRDPY